MCHFEVILEKVTYMVILYIIYIYYINIKIKFLFLVN